METILQVGVKALIHNNSHKFLLLKRSEKYKSIAGQWDIPGGRIEPDANLLTNLGREIKEETNLDLNSKPTLLAAQDIQPNHQLHIVRLTYLARATGTLNLQSSEATTHQWLSWSELTQLNNLDPYVKELIINPPQPLHHLLQSEYVEE